MTAEQGWTTHQDPAGFTIEIPVGWRVSTDGGRVTVAGPNAERVTILPLQIEGQLDARSAQATLVGLSGRMWPQQKWTMPRSGWQFGQNGVRAVGADESTLREITALWWANTPRGAALFFYGIAGQPSRFQSLEPVFARVLGSFRVTPGGGPQAGGGGRAGGDPLASMRFKQWVDPTENAFSIEVPADWGVQGGIKRSDVEIKKNEWVSYSPDGQVMIRGGDVNLPAQYIEPAQVITNMGYREGQWYQGGMFISRFMPGFAYASQYVQMKFGQNCSNLELVYQKERPDYVQQLERQGLTMQGYHTTAGEVAFTCQINGQPYTGYVFAETSAAPSMGVATIWSSRTLYGFLAPSNRAREADAVLHRAVASFSVNPQWAQRELRMERRQLDELNRYREFAYNLQKQTQADRWASWDRISEKTQDVLSGKTNVIDPQTGQQYKAQAGSSYYWIDPTRNVIAGTNLPYQPTWDFREMVQTYR
ncbi:MAG TPA: hypothetical protein VM911_09130 [Pyrinomonadaceae bacterium]|nr:hypothetical protein [Pyrinomonadaceae bacterium]